jgi:F0F1-type ATP synthase delta subunit
MKKLTTTAIVKSLLPLVDADKKTVAVVVDELVKQLVKQKRFRQLPYLVKLLQNEIDKKQKVLRAEVTVGEKLTTAQEKQIKDFLQKTYAPWEIILETKINKEQVGVAVVTRDTFYDLSLENQLKRLQRVLVS